MDHNYLTLTISVLIFGVQFWLSDVYRKENGASRVSVFTFNFLCAVAGALCLCIINGFDLYLAPFTCVIAIIAALNSILFNICSLRSLEKVNLSKYSLYSMLGGMLLPFAVGIAFYNESITLAKVLCTLVIIVALALTVERKGNDNGGYIYYVGVFIFNGMSGVLSKIHTDAMANDDISTSSAAGYSIWLAIFTAVISLVAIVILRKEFKMPNVKAIMLGFGNGALSKIANFLLLIALTTLPATVQYPFVTGGIIIVSTFIAVLTRRKPSKKEFISVALAFVGILLLVCIPV